MAIFLLKFAVPSRHPRLQPPRKPRLIEERQSKTRNLSALSPAHLGMDRGPVILPKLPPCPRKPLPGAAPAFMPALPDAPVPVPSLVPTPAPVPAKRRAGLAARRSRTARRVGIAPGGLRKGRRSHRKRDRQGQCHRRTHCLTNTHDRLSSISASETAEKMYERHRSLRTR